MKASYSVILTTTSSKEEAQKIALSLVEHNLAACVQMVPIQSCYRWQGEIVNDAEVLLIIKAKREQYKKIETTILENHSYEIPEIIEIPFENGFAPYLQWISGNG